MDDADAVVDGVATARHSRHADGAVTSNAARISRFAHLDWSMRGILDQEDHIAMEAGNRAHAECPCPALHAAGMT